MSDRPMTFSAPMVRALLAGTKTVTRRVMKPQPPDPPPTSCHPNHQASHPAPYLDAYCSERKTKANPRGMSRDWCWWQVDDRQCLPMFRCPIAAGDTIWVREAWRTMDGLDRLSPKQIAAQCLEAGYRTPWAPMQYEADGEKDRWYRGDFGTSAGRYRHARFMPRWASRISLRVVSVRAERVQEITEAESIAEGVKPILVPPDGGGSPHVEAFRELWDNLHGQGAWERNDWVWRIELEVT